MLKLLHDERWNRLVRWIFAICESKKCKIKIKVLSIRSPRQLRTTSQLLCNGRGSASCSSCCWQESCQPQLAPHEPSCQGGGWRAVFARPTLTARSLESTILATEPSRVRSSQRRCFSPSIGSKRSMRMSSTPRRCPLPAVVTASSPSPALRASCGRARPFLRFKSTSLEASWRRSRRWFSP